MWWGYCRSKKEKMQMALQWDKSLCYRWKYFPDRSLLLITELCPWARCFYPADCAAPRGRRLCISSRPRSGTALQSPSNARSCLGWRAPGQGGQLGWEPTRAPALSPGNHILVRLTKGPRQQLGTAVLQTPQAGLVLLPYCGAPRTTARLNFE